MRPFLMIFNILIVGCTEVDPHSFVLFNDACLCLTVYTLASFYLTSRSGVPSTLYRITLCPHVI